MSKSRSVLVVEALIAVLKEKPIDSYAPRVPVIYSDRPLIMSSVRIGGRVSFSRPDARENAFFVLSEDLRAAISAQEPHRHSTTNTVLTTRIPTFDDEECDTALSELAIVSEGNNVVSLRGGVGDSVEASIFVYLTALEVALKSCNLAPAKRSRARD